MNKTTIILFILVVVVNVCAGYDYPKPDCKFDVEDIAPNPSKRKAVRGVFFYTYNDNIDDREVEMHELSTQAFKKLISSSEYVKSPAVLKSTYDLVSFFDGRCQTSINCERLPQKCPVTTIKSTTTEPPKTLKPWPSNIELQEITARIYYNYAPYLAESQLDEILTSLKNTNEFTKYWSASQIHEIGTRNSFIVQDHLEKQNTSGIYSVMKFSDETKQHMINYTKEIVPSLSLDEILEVISNAEDIGTAHMRYLTLNQYKELRAQLVAAFADYAKNHGFISTTKEPPITSTIAVEPWSSNNEIQERSLSIYYDFAPHLTQSQLDEILNSLKHMNEYTKYWTASQVDEISTRNSLIVQDHLQKQNTSGINSVMRFSNETKQHMINYTREINPNLSLDEILGMISIVEEIGTAHMKYLTLDQFKGLRGPVVAVFANNTEIHGFISTTKAPTTTAATTTTKNTTTTKPVPTKATEPWPSNNELQKISESIYYDFAPHLTESQLNEILTSLKNMNEYTKYWTAYQVNEISTRNSLIVQEYLQKQKNPGINSVMRFSDETKQHMIKYTQEINPNLSLDEILGMISIVEEIGTAHMRYVTLDQYKKLRGEVVAAFADNTEIHGFVSTSKAPTTTTTTKKPAITTKTYIPPAKSIRKPYTRWAGQTYRQYTGQYSFGYTWRPFTGGYSWRTRHYTDGSTTTTERYRQRSFANEFNPVEN